MFSDFVRQTDADRNSLTSINTEMNVRFKNLFDLIAADDPVNVYDVY